MSIKNLINLGFTFGILLIFGCTANPSSYESKKDSPSEEANKINSLVDVKTTFVTSSNFNETEVGMLVNLVGAHTGFGDITGPLWTMFDLKELLPDKKIVAVIDDYSYKVLKNMYQFNDISELDKLIGVNFISPNQAKIIQSANIILELFSADRNHLVQKNHPFKKENTIVIISDPMHCSTLDYIQAQNDVQLYFNPPGIGINRSGIVNNPEIGEYLNKPTSERRKIAAKHFPDGVVQSILTQNILREAKIGFLYGAHNTAKWEHLSSQTKTFLAEVKK